MSSTQGPDTIAVRQVDLYETPPKIHPRAVDGRFVRLRAALRYGFLVLLVAAPWIPWGDRQAILLDLPDRQFHIFGITFFPQDFILVSFALIIGAFALFTVTNWLGRVWCGYACPQSVWFQLFIDIEQWLEGPRHRRIRQDAGPRTGSWWWMKVRKWALWLALAVITGVSIVGLFVPIRELLPDLATLSASGWATFWVGFFVTATFVMGALLREQVCLYMCPYARFQSAMFDPDTLVVSYDPNRGEPRGSRPRKADPDALGLGDCIDCELCVQVCPVGIDIREGLQYECISCAHCIDACDSVMDRMNYPRGLIRYTTEHDLEGGRTRTLRPRLVGYALVLVAMVGIFGALAIGRGIAELDVLRDRGSLYQQVFVDGTPRIENAYSLRLVNKSQAARDWRIEVSGLEGATVLGDRELRIDAGAVATVPLRLRAPPRDSFSTPVTFRVVEDDRTLASADSTFMFGARP